MLGRENQSLKQPFGWRCIWEICSALLGQGNVAGNSIEPDNKIPANPSTVRSMGEHVDISGILRRDQTIYEAGGALIELIRRTAKGRNTAA